MTPQITFLLGAGASKSFGLPLTADIFPRIWQKIEDKNFLDFQNEVAKLNVHHTVKEILSGSDIIADLVKKGSIDIVPAMYDIATGEVSFYDSVNGVKAEQLANAIANN